MWSAAGEQLLCEKATEGDVKQREMSLPEVPLLPLFQFFFFFSNM